MGPLFLLNILYIIIRLLYRGSTQRERDRDIGHRRVAVRWSDSLPVSRSLATEFYTRQRACDNGLNGFQLRPRTCAPATTTAGAGCGTPPPQAWARAVAFKAMRAIEPSSLSSIVGLPAFQYALECYSRREGGRSGA
jgi:hypothetical protein